jgi:transcriptional regulator with GAF, ATPase, and Fis domain/tetratricopeptide (TPR) repeat protein
MKDTDGTSDKLEQLRARVDSAATPAERVEATLLLAEAIWLSDPVAAKPLLEQVLAEADAAGRLKDKGRAAYMLGELLRRAGDLDEAARCAEMVFKVADATGDRRTRASALNLAGSMHGQRGEHQSAVECFEEYLEISRQIGFGKGERSALNQLACTHALRGDLEKALERYRQCLDANTKAGDAHGRATSLYNIGWTLAATGRWTEATENFYRAMALCEEHGFSDPLAASRMALGELSQKRSEYDDAAFMFRAVIEAERENRRTGGVYREALSNLGWTHFRKGDLAQAEEVLSEAARLCEKAGDRGMLATVCCRRAELALARGWLDAVGDLLAVAMHHATDLNLPTQQGEVLRVEALLSVARGDSAQALELLSRSEIVLAPLGDTFELALARLQRGRELLEVNRCEEARAKLQTAAETFRRLAVVAEAEEATRLLYRLEMSTDRNAALSEGLLSITALELPPEQFIGKALSMICDSWGFEQGAVLVGGRPVALKGQPDLAELPRPHASPTQTDLALLLPVRRDRRLLGSVWLRRAQHAPTRVEHGLLELVSRALAPSLASLAELVTIETGRTLRIPGLRYRGVVGRSRDVLDVLGQIPRVAATTVPVLICGESGSGKELVARAVHESGPRVDHPFVTVNCAAVPENLLEAEFFGVEKGAATGVAARPGKFELADKGSIFLDEIGDMSPALQARFLRVIEDKVITRVGGAKQSRVDVRVIAATNMDLGLRERQGLFRRDLLYRLNTVQLVLPPLRRRKRDLPVLTQYFIVRAAQEYNRPVHGASDDVLALFARFDWPGNIRQLQHVVERAVILAASDTLQVADLPLDLRPRRPVPTSAVAALTRPEQRKAADENERATLLDALGQTKGNVSEAARLSGYSRAQFYRLLRKHHIKS